MQYLKQSTAATFRIGPFLDDTDGKTAETGLTISQADIRLSKANGAFAQKNDATASAHDENGWYTCILNTTDTNTLGNLIIAVHESGALPVWREFTILSANVYDSLVGGGDTLEVDMTAISGDATAANNLETACDGGSYNVGGGAIVAASVTAEVSADVAKISGDATAADNLEAIMDGTGAVMTLTQLRINSAAAGGAIDIDNSGGNGINIDASTAVKLTGSVIGLDISAGGFNPAVKLECGSGNALYASSLGAETIKIESLSGGKEGILVLGRGAYAGIRVQGGLTGDGVSILGGDTSGRGLSISTVDGEGINIASAGAGQPGINVYAAQGQGIAVGIGSGNFTGIAIIGKGTEAGIYVEGGDTGNAVEVRGGVTSGNGLDILVSGALSKPVYLAGGSIGIHIASNTGISIDASAGHGISASVAGDYSAIRGFNNSAVFPTFSMMNANAGGDAVNFTGGQHGIKIISTTAGNGIDISTVDGNGILIDAGLSGHGIAVTTDNGNGIDVRCGAGGFGCGAYLVGANTGSGLNVEGGTDGIGFRVTGHGIASGIRIDAGATGNGVDVSTTAGHGINIAALGSAKHGMKINTNTGNGIDVSVTSIGEGIKVVAGGTGAGLNISGGTFGIGASFVGGVTAGNGMSISARGNNDSGILIQGEGNGYGIQAVAGVSGDISTLLDEITDEPFPGAPSATPSAKTILSWLWAQIRNKGTFSKTTMEKIAYNDAGVALAKKIVTDTGTVYTEDEMTTV